MGVLLVCMPAGRKDDWAEQFFNSSLSRSIFPDLVGGRERGAGVSLLFAAALLVCMPGNREGERAGHLNLLRIPG